MTYRIPILEPKYTSIVMHHSSRRQFQTAALLIEVLCEGPAKFELEVPAKFFTVAFTSQDSIFKSVPDSRNRGSCQFAPGGVPQASCPV